MKNNISLKQLNYSSEYAIIFYLAVFKILIHLLNPEYGYHRDELFYLFVSNNFSFSNLDVLPLTPIYLKLITLLFGESIKAIHFASALCGSFSVIFTCLITKELGGRRVAITFAGLSTIFSGFLIFGSLFTYDSLDFLCIVATIYFVVKIIKEDKPSYWLIIGGVIGAGLLNKLTILNLCLSLIVVLALTPQRKYFCSKWFWCGSLLALLFLLPFIIWQSKNGWYFINWAQNYAGGISYVSSFTEFVWNQILPNNVINVLIWLPGLYLLLFSKEWKKYRLLGYIFIFQFFLIYYQGGKFYFLVPYYTILFAVGSIKIEMLLNKLKSQRKRTLQISLPLLYVVLSLVSVPMMMPILSVENYADFTKLLGISSDANVKHENNALNQFLPQHFADRFGWEELTKTIYTGYQTMSITEQDSLGGIICANFGQASAINFYRSKFNLPMAIYNRGWFYYDAKNNHKFRGSYIALLQDTIKLKEMFSEVRQIGYFSHQYCMPYETNKKIYLCKKAKNGLAIFWGK